MPMDHPMHHMGTCLIKWRKLGIFFALLREACYKGDGDNIKNSGKRKKVKRVKEWEKEKVLFKQFVLSCK